MTPCNPAEVYCIFRRSLQDLRSHVVQANPDVRSLQAQFLDVQQYAQTTLLTVDALSQAEEAVSKQVAYQTEISKELRLLGMDLMFLQSARQALKMQQRQAQVRDRLDRLMGYCDRLSELLNIS